MRKLGFAATVNTEVRSLVAAAGAAALVLSPAVATAATPTVVEQGKAIYIEGHGACTIGYNDVANRKSYTAAHCGSEGARVSLMDRATMEFSEEMGTFHPSKNFTRLPYNDWGWIEWDAGVAIAGNSYSGDKVLIKDDVKIGDEVCSHGETSHMGTRNILCGTFAGWSAESFGVQLEGWQQGDSGGPVWVPGRGFLGVMSAAALGETKAPSIVIGGKRQTGKPVGWAASIHDGETLSDYQFQIDFAKAGGLDTSMFEGNPGTPGTTRPPIAVPNLPTKPAPAPVPGQPGTQTSNQAGTQPGAKQDAQGEKGSSTSSSSLSTGEIIGIIVSILIAAIPVAMQFL
ncbi:hypothetical protein [Corynebacterium sp. HMSC08F01]|uniref:hypothetical protein n=1 Tax=Corynebacterium sp. HMSC08F01 TaxID=1581139 RepID=UPI000A54F4B9|nr:hypothetical protein [Corynebacterium sp. HMSC08F01]